jgi:putrescine transport system permease protein
LAAVLLPFWTSFLIRVYAWIAILKDEGLLNAALVGLGLIRAPLALLNTDIAVVIGIVYAYLPFMILPLYVAFARIPASLIEAAADLGATPTRAFWSVTLPLTAPGIAAGSLLVFIPAVGEAIVPDLLGGAETLMIGKSLWTEFFQNRDWPLASAIAVLLLILLVGPTAWLEGREARRRETGA